MQALEIILRKAERTIGEKEKESMIERKNQSFCELVNALLPSDLLPGAKELITELKSHGWKIAFCSSSKNAGLYVADWESDPCSTLSLTERGLTILDRIRRYS